MSRRLWVVLVAIGVTPRYQCAARGNRPGKSRATVLIAGSAHLKELQAQYRTILRMAQGSGTMERYRVPAIALTRHDAARWLYGRPWVQGLNGGDATGAAYRETTLPLEPPSTFSRRG